jgi:hypothetical protein
MNLIKLIKEEIENFDWIKGIEPDTDLSLGLLWYRYDGFSEHSRPYVAKLFTEEFNDIEVNGDKIYLNVDSYCEFSDFFLDDRGGYSYVNKTLAEAIFCEEDYWEPYHDVIYDWEDQVWDMVENDPELLKYIVEHIRENYLGNIEETITYDGNDVVFDEKFLNHLYTKNTAQLGFIIDGYDDFSELKHELSWAYESGYNVAARDNIYYAAMEPITENFGKGKWESYVVRKLDGDVTRHKLVFDITGLFWDVVDKYFSECWGKCDNWYSRENGIEKNTEDFEEWCDECHDMPSGSFMELYEELVIEEESWNPRFYEYPDSDKIREYFREDVYSRI